MNWQNDEKLKKIEDDKPRYSSGGGQSLQQVSLIQELVSYNLQMHTLVKRLIMKR